MAEATAANRPTSRGSRTLWVLVRIEALLTLSQAVLAGGLLAGHPAMRSAHHAEGGVLWELALATMIVALVGWARRRVSRSAAGGTALLWAALWAQMVTGSRGEVWVHVPLGVAIFGLTVALVHATRMPRHREAVPA